MLKTKPVRQITLAELKAQARGGYPRPTVHHCG